MSYADSTLDLMDSQSQSEDDAPIRPSSGQLKIIMVYTLGFQRFEGWYRRAYSCRSFPKFHQILLEATPLRRWFEWTGIPAGVDMRNESHNRLMRVDCIYGAAMLIRNSAVRRLGGFDEGYHYQYEDHDLCFSFASSGCETWYQPEAVVTHLYDREERGVFRPRLRTHVCSIFRFQVRNMWKLSRSPAVHRRDLDGNKVAVPQNGHVSAELADASGRAS